MLAPREALVGSKNDNRVLQLARLFQRCHQLADTFVDGQDALLILSHAFIERFRFGVALHVGQILYGNIGGGSRLDFTCIGPAINLAARLEKLTGRLRRTIVASEGFAGICAGGWRDLGEFPIAGFAKAQRVYGLHDEETAAAA